MSVLRSLYVLPLTVRMILSGVILPRLLAYGVNLSPDQYADRGG